MNRVSSVRRRAIMIASMKKVELQELLRENGLPTSGTKKVLIQRLKAVIHDKQSPQQPLNQNKSDSDTGVSDSSDDEVTVTNARASSTPAKEIRPHRKVQSDSIRTDRIALEDDRIAFERYMLEKERELLAAQKELLSERQRTFAATASTLLPQNETRARSFTVREIGDIMPEFNPSDKSSGSCSAERFIKRICDLQDIYNFDEKLVLFAAQSKLRGYARTWNDDCFP